MLKLPLNEPVQVQESTTPRCWNLYVGGRLCVADESFVVCDGIAAALRGESWPCRELQEVAATILGSR